MTLSPSSQPPWQGQNAWRILDTDFEIGLAFFSKWRQWQLDVHRPRMLHYVALCANPCTAQVLRDVGEAHPDLTVQSQALAARWFGLLPGFHRFLLDDGHVVLTLCVGDRLKLLHAQQFKADVIKLNLSSCDPEELAWLCKSLARCCRRGTALTLQGLDAAKHSTVPTCLKQSGFTFTGDASPTDCCYAKAQTWQFDPHWALKATRQNDAIVARPVGRCAVIGAGLAGACVAAALARRGWQVQVLDKGTEPASGASGLPVGLVLPHVSSDDCALSRLSRAGVRLMLQQARDLLEIDLDWAPSGVLEREVGGSPLLPARWPPAGRSWFEAADKLNGIQDHGQGIWHHQGAWIKPAALVNAWLTQPGIQFQALANVVDLQPAGAGWQLLGDAGQVLCQADCVVFANASGAFELLRQLEQTILYIKGLEHHLIKTQDMRGLLSWQLHDPKANNAFAPFPVNGSGSMVANIPMANSTAWFMGSTYQPGAQPERDDLANQANNFAHLQLLLPKLADQLAPQFASNALRHWKGTRCVTKDRLPAVGPLTPDAQPSLWLCAGMGSRGLSFTVLCAEMLAARLCAEPWPLEAKLARLIEAVRA